MELEKKTRCETCRFYDADRGLSFSGKCRRNAPLVTTAISVWPRVDNDDWCGEYEAKAITPAKADA